MREREKERIALLGAAGSDARLDANSDGRGYRGQLPHMQGDVLAFFHALEKTLHLNNVPQTELAKLLLSAKAANFDFVKKTILTSFRLTPVTYLQKFKSITRSGSETYNLFGNRLEDLFSLLFEFERNF